MREGRRACGRDRFLQSLASEPGVGEPARMDLPSRASQPLCTPLADAKGRAINTGVAWAEFAGCGRRQHQSSIPFSISLAAMPFWSGVEPTTVCFCGKSTCLCCHLGAEVDENPTRRQPLCGTRSI